MGMTALAAWTVAVGSIFSIFSWERGRRFELEDKHSRVALALEATWAAMEKQLPPKNGTDAEATFLGSVAETAFLSSAADVTFLGSAVRLRQDGTGQDRAGQDKTGKGQAQMARSLAARYAFVTDYATATTQTGCVIISLSLADVGLALDLPSCNSLRCPPCFAITFGSTIFKLTLTGCSRMLMGSGASAVQIGTGPSSGPFFNVVQEFTFINADSANDAIVVDGAGAQVTIGASKSAVAFCFTAGVNRLFFPDVASNHVAMQTTTTTTVPAVWELGFGALVNQLVDSNGNIGLGYVAENKNVVCYRVLTGGSKSYCHLAPTAGLSVMVQPYMGAFQADNFYGSPIFISLPNNRTLMLYVVWGTPSNKATVLSVSGATLSKGTDVEFLGGTQVDQMAAAEMGCSGGNCWVVACGEQTNKWCVAMKVTNTLITLNAIAEITDASNNFYNVQMAELGAPNVLLCYTKTGYQCQVLAGDLSTGDFTFSALQSVITGYPGFVNMIGITPNKALVCYFSSSQILCKGLYAVGNTITASPEQFVSGVPWGKNSVARLKDGLASVCLCQSSSVLTCAKVSIEGSQFGATLQVEASTSVNVSGTGLSSQSDIVHYFTADGRAMVCYVASDQGGGSGGLYCRVASIPIAL